MNRVVGPSNLLTGQAGIRQGLFLYRISNGVEIYKIYGKVTNISWRRQER